MVIGIGVDLVSVQGFAPKLAGDAFRRRVFSRGEEDACRGSAAAPRAYAEVFAVKEAAMKALGAGIGSGVGFVEFRVCRETAVVHVGGRAAERAAELGGATFRYTIGGTPEYVQAVVLLEGPGR